MNDAALDNLYNELRSADQDLNGIDSVIQNNDSDQSPINGDLDGSNILVNTPSPSRGLISRYEIDEHIKTANEELKKIAEQKRQLESKEVALRRLISGYKELRKVHEDDLDIDGNEDESLENDLISNQISDENSSHYSNSNAAISSNDLPLGQPSSDVSSNNCTSNAKKVASSTNRCQKPSYKKPQSSKSSSKPSSKATNSGKGIRYGQRPQRGKQMRNMMTFKSLPFVYDCFADELLKPQTFSSQINTIRFELNVDQIGYLKDKKFSDTEPNMKVLLRCCQITHRKSSYNDKIPKALIIRINGWLMKFDNIKNRELKAPLDITPYCNKSSVPNEIVLEWPIAQWETKIRNLGVAVYFAKRLDLNQNLNILNGRDYLRDPNATLKLVKKKVSLTNDMICSDALRLPLTCPITNTLINIPCIGIKCQHLQCFDGKSFLEITKMKNEWSCPFCKKQIGWNELRVDGLMKDILQKTGGSCMQIEFDSNINWKPLYGNINQQAHDASAITLDHPENVAIITLSSDEEKYDSSETDITDSDTEDNDDDDDEENDIDSDERDSDCQDYGDGKSKGSSKSSYHLRNRSSDGKYLNNKRKRTK